jgi:hypothetical protein
MPQAKAAQSLSDTRNGQGDVLKMILARRGSGCITVGFLSDQSTTSSGSHESCLSRFDVLIHAEEVGWIVLLLDHYQPFEMGSESSVDDLIS